jgi:hypothetical protein
MKHVIVVAGLLLAVASCGDEQRGAKKKRPQVAAAGEVEAPTGKPAPADEAEAVLKSADAEGRCENLTPQTPYDSVFFYPSHNEMFVPTQAGSTFRLPIRVRKEDGPNVEFDYKWAKDETGPGADHPAAVTAREDGKLAFSFDTLKPTFCIHSAHDDFYSPVDNLGIQAGAYRSGEADDELEFVAGEQKIVSREKGKTSIAYYRVKSTEDSSTVLYVSNNPPDDGRPTVWVEWRVGAAGSTVVVDYMGKFKRSYDAVPTD